MKRLVEYLLFTATTLYTALIYRSDAFLMIFFIEIFAFLVFCLINFLNSKSLDFSINIPVQTVQLGNVIPVEIVIYNKGLIPSGMMEVKVSSMNTLTGTKELTKFYASADTSNMLVPIKINCGYATKDVGIIEFEIDRVKVRDYLGITRVAVSLYDDGTKSVYVLPKLYDIPVNISNHTDMYVSEFQDIKEDFCDCNDERTEIRQYIPGDNLKNIHWKLSAKSDELLVRQNSIVNISVPVLYILTDGFGSSDKRNKFIQTVMSISKSLVNNEFIHFVCWYDVDNADIKRHFIKDETSVYELIVEGNSIFMGRTGNQDSIYTDIYTMKKLYESKYNEHMESVYMALNTELEFWINDEIVIKYDAGDLESSLMSAVIDI